MIFITHGPPYAVHGGVVRKDLDRLAQNPFVSHSTQVARFPDCPAPDFQEELFPRQCQSTAHHSSAMDALDRGEWPNTETEIRVTRASLFTAQTIAQDLISAGREGDVRETRKFVSTIMPEPATVTEQTSQW